MDNCESELSLLCRICGTQNEYFIPIFDGEGLKHSLETKIQIHLPIQVLRGDALPSHVCYDCASAIISWHDLYINCREANVKLYNLVMNNQEDGLDYVDLKTAACSPYMHLITNPQTAYSSDQSNQSINKREKSVVTQNVAKHSPIKNNSDGVILKKSVLHYTSQVSQNALNSFREPSSMVMEPSLCCSVGTQTEESSSAMESSPCQHVNNKKFAMAKKGVKTRHIVLKKRKAHIGSNIQESQASSNHPSSHSFDSKNEGKLWPRRVSAIQSASSCVESSAGRSESVLVRNESVWKDSFSQERIGCMEVSSQALRPSFQENVTVSELGVHNKNFPSSTVVSFARPSCLRRATTKCSEITVSEERKYKEWPAENYEGVIVASPQGQVHTSGVTEQEERRSDPSRTCFHCRKVINNKILLHSHEKGHLSEQQPPTSFVCKFCSQPQNSFNEMSSHHAYHEANAERERKVVANRRVLLCKFCGRMCTTEEKFSLHQRAHLDSIEACIYTCRTRGESFNTRSKLSAHLLSHVTKPSMKILKCHICGQGFSTKSAVLEHRLKHTKEERSCAFKCAICGMAFGNNILLGKHRATHSEEELARPFKCKFCGKAFARNHTLQIHHLSHSDEKNHLCSHCGKGFKMRNSLIQHLRTHQDPSVWPSYPCQLCSRSFRVKSRLRDHLRLHSGEKPFVCSICGKQFHKIGALHTHEVCHTDRRPYICDICGKTFKWSKNLCQHKTVHGNTDKRLENTPSQATVKSKSHSCQCEVCGKQLAGRSGLLQHLAKLHNKKTQKITTCIPCLICGKTLSSARSLVQHMKINHVGVKAFKCDLCERAYSSKVARDDHRRSHTGERPFVCNNCSKTFTSLSNLLIHRTTHSEERPYKCSFCQKQFKRNAHLILHIRTHTGEKPYVCNVCNRGFAQSNDLHKHRLTHSSDKAFTCQCGMAFRLKRDLTRHKPKCLPSQEQAQPSDSTCLDF